MVIAQPRLAYGALVWLLDLRRPNVNIAVEAVAGDGSVIGFIGDSSLCALIITPRTNWRYGRCDEQLFWLR
jgi:hypothetical protein